MAYANYAPPASLAMERCLNLGGLGPGPAEVIKSCLPLHSPFAVPIACEISAHLPVHSAASWPLTQG